MPTLDRIVTETSRASEYFSTKELQAQTGQPAHRFAAVILKELLDNGADAAETMGMAPVLNFKAETLGRWLRLTVQDNGSGLPAEVIDRILNFQTRTSDKAIYRTPTRGLQGNALKTIFGIPFALGARRPVVLEAHRLRHRITAWVDPAGEVRTEHKTEPSPVASGTRVTVTLPVVEDQDFSARSWARGFALFNPHASVRFREIRSPGKHAYGLSPRVGQSYRALAAFPKPWSKYVPTDRPSAWWFDESSLARLVFAHIAAARQDQTKDMLLRGFVRMFHGLSATAKLKAVCDQLPEIERLSSFEKAEERVAGLLKAMQAEADPPSPNALGCVGKDYFEQRFNEWYGVKRSWYRRVSEVHDGVPFVFEVVLAETKRDGQLFHGVNFSPTFEDPLANTPFRVPDEFTAYGMGSFLSLVHAHPTRTETRVKTAAAFHLICPAPEFLDRGKTRLKVPEEIASAIANRTWLVTKEIYREEERRQKDAARQERADVSRERATERVPEERECSHKDAVFAVLPEAFAKASGDGKYPVSARTLYYQVRPLIQKYTRRELGYSYFSQKLLTLYQQKRGAIEGLYYEPRGILNEPHTKKSVPLGTREVADYEFPRWVYDKILYIEKKGLWPILQKARLAERHDMAIVAGEGYASEACRALFAQAEQGRSYQLFVAHDADPAGYNIARTLREETERMPGHRVDVIDLGLKLEDALAMRLPAEKFTRKKALPEELQLTETERRYFEGVYQGRKTWIAQRVELNALSAPQLVQYIEEKLRAAGVRGKVIPDAEALPLHALGILHGEMEIRVKAIFEKLVPLPSPVENRPVEYASE